MLGKHAADVPFLAPLTFAVPNGWSGNIGGPYLVALGTNDDRSYFLIEILNKPFVYADPCHNDRGFLNPLPGPSVDDLVTALKSMPSVTVSPVSDRSIGGLAAKQLMLTAPNSFADCTLTSDGQFQVWQPGWGVPDDMTPGESQQISIVEVDGQRLVIVTSASPGADTSAIEGILESISFTPQH